MPKGAHLLPNNSAWSVVMLDQPGQLGETFLAGFDHVCYRGMGEGEAEHIGNLVASPKRRDPPLWKAGGGIATVERISVAMGRRSVCQVSDQIGRGVMG